VNPRQRRGILLIAIAVVGAVGVFIAVSNYLADVRTQLGPMVSVVVSTEDLPPLARPADGQLATVEMPRRWLPPNALQNPDQIGDRITATVIPANTILSEGMFTVGPDIEAGQREIAIMVDVETGVGGKIVSGSVVDIFATFAGDDQTGQPPSARIVVQRAMVIDVGSPVDVPEGAPGPGSVGFGSGQRVPVTFQLSIQDAARLVYVESFATSVRLALRAPLDSEVFDDPAVSIFDQLGQLGRAFDPILGPGEVAPAGPDTEETEEQAPPPPPPDDEDGDDGDEAEDGDDDGDDQ
jgi:Flp pilus assembly protein CpaB